MPNFIIVYHGRKQPESPEAGAEAFGRWQAWVADQGDNMINPGSPMMHTKFVTEDGVTDGDETAISGYSVIKADHMDAALAVAKACPFIEMGKLEVAELMQM